MNEYNLKTCPKVQDLFSAIKKDLLPEIIDKPLNNPKVGQGIIKDFVIKPSIEYHHNYTFVLSVLFKNEIIEIYKHQIYDKAVLTIIEPYFKAFKKAWSERIKALEKEGFYIENETALASFGRYDENDEPVEIEELYIPEEITSIGWDADKRVFHGLIKRIYFHENIVKIDEGCTFRDNRVLEFVDLANIKDIPNSSFEGCYNLKEIKSNYPLKTSPYCFFHCFSLKKVNCEMDNIEQAFGDTDVFDYALLSKKESSYRKNNSDFSFIHNHEDFYNNGANLLVKRGLTEVVLRARNSWGIILDHEQVAINNRSRIINGINTRRAAIDTLVDEYGFEFPEPDYCTIADYDKFYTKVNEYQDDKKEHVFAVFNDLSDVCYHLSYLKKCLDYEDVLMRMDIFDVKSLTHDNLITIKEILSFAKDFVALGKIEEFGVKELNVLNDAIDSLLNNKKDTSQEFLELVNGLDSYVLPRYRRMIYEAFIVLFDEENGTDIAKSLDEYGIKYAYTGYFYFFGVDGDITHAVACENAYEYSDYYFMLANHLQTLVASILFNYDEKQYMEIYNDSPLLEIGNYDFERVINKSIKKEKEDEYAYLWYTCGLEDPSFDFNDYLIKYTDLTIEEGPDDDQIIRILHQLYILDIEASILNKDYATFMFYYNLTLYMQTEDYYEPGHFYFDSTLFLTELSVTDKENFEKITEVRNQPID